MSPVAKLMHLFMELIWIAHSHTRQKYRKLKKNKKENRNRKKEQIGAGRRKNDTIFHKQWKSRDCQ